MENERNKLQRGQVVKYDLSEYIIKLINEKENANKIFLLSYHEKISYLLKIY